MGEDGKAQPVVFTVGHSTLPLAEFIRILEAHDVALLADVRSVPRSRHNPQFNRDVLPGSLDQVGIGYVHMDGLGGFRKPAADSVNRGWKNSTFRGYADYMQTEDFELNVRKLVETATNETVSVMCSEAVPWRCHRSLIADALVIRGFPVIHIMSAGGDYSHRLTPFAVVDGGRITYPAAEELTEADDST
jgi:uncharacterized protein (DUF488 family)